MPRVGSVEREVARDKNVRFIRKKGRVIPIRTKKGKRDDRVKRAVGRASGMAAATGGGIIAADALRTKRVYVDKARGITMDRKFVYSPGYELKQYVREIVQSKGRRKEAFRTFVGEALSDHIVLRKKGKYVGYMEWGKEEGRMMTRMVSIKEGFRGKGYSKLLTKEAARSARVTRGIKETYDQVVHPGSVLSNYDPKRTRYFQEYERFTRERRSKKWALDRAVKAQRRHKRLVEKAGKNPFKQYKLSKEYGDIPGGAAYRSDKIPRLPGKTKFANVKGFRTTGNKVRIGLGGALAIGGLATYAMNRRKNGGGR